MMVTMERRDAKSEADSSPGGAQRVDRTGALSYESGRMLDSLPSVSTCCEAGQEVEMNESEGLRRNVRNGDDKSGVRPAFCGGE
jgi:hypothetical protein